MKNYPSFLQLVAWRLLSFLLLSGGCLTSALAQAPAKSSKRGVAYGYHSVADMQALAPGVSWWYNWASRPDAAVVNVYQSLNVDYAPMQWNGRFGTGTVTADQLAANIPAGAKYLLGFNEPNFISQGNMTPRQAAALWPVLEEVARRKNLKLVSPALNYCGDCVSENGVTYNSPTKWLDAFFAAYPTAQVDYIAIHTYVCEERYLRPKIDELKKYGKPIWLTEFSCGDMTPSQITLAVQKKYMTDAVNYLENEPSIFRYSWFAGRNNEIPFINLLGADGQLTELGRLYVSLPAGNVVIPNRLTPSAISASSQENPMTGPGNANDQNLNTRWSSAFEDPQSLQYDFGQPVDIARIRISWEAAYARDYKLETSLDGRSWTLIHAVIDGDGGLDDVTGLSVRGRYLRMQGTRRATTFGYSIYEMAVYGPGSAALATKSAVSNGLEVYPNPVADQLQLKLSGSLQRSQYRILDPLGRVLRTGSAASGSVNVAALQPGLYTLLLTQDGQQTARRFTKQ